MTSKSKKYTVDYTAKTAFKKGKAADLRKGARVSVTGKLTKSTIKATSITV
jgi:hypothetical protein